MATLFNHLIHVSSLLVLVQILPRQQHLTIFNLPQNQHTPYNTTILVSTYRAILGTTLDPRAFRALRSRKRWCRTTFRVRMREMYGPISMLAIAVLYVIEGDEIIPEV